MQTHTVPTESAKNDIPSPEWDSVDTTLANLFRDPSSSVDPDATAPSRTSILAAMRLAALLKFLGHEVPSAVVVDGNGGMMFEWQLGPVTRWLEIAGTGEMEHVLLRDGQRVFRRTFELRI